MPRLLNMPEVSTGASEAVVSEWLADEGGSVAAGEPLVSIETDKAVVEVEAEDAVVLGRVLAPAGATVEVGSPVALLLAPGEEVDVDAALADLGVAPAATTGDPPPAVGPGEPVVTLPAPAATGEQEGRRNRTFASPLARKMLKDAGVPLDGITGSGPGGRIVRKDAEQAIASSPSGGDAATPLASTSLQQTPPEAELETPVQAEPSSTPPPAPVRDGAVPHSRLRRAVAARLTRSKQEAPHFYVKGSVRLDALLALRAQVNEVSPVRISVNDFVLKAVGLASARVPDANVTWGEDAMDHHGTVDVGVAIASSRGLVTPVVRAVETTSVGRIAAQVRDLAARADEGKLSQRELDGGTIAVTNLGMHGVEEFSAIINPPHSAILAVGAGRRVPVVEDSGDLGVATVMSVVLSVDHRAIDGALAAQWLRAFTEVLERPLSTLAG